MALAPSVPGVFLSHSHVDKSVARRLVRRLMAHGINVWLDERELKLGAALTDVIREQIQHADLLLVITSQQSATSKWVGLELEFARAHDKAIVPFFIEPLDTHERFRDDLGVMATSPQAFADAVRLLLAGRVVRDGEPQRPQVRPELDAVVQHHDRAQPLPHVMQVIGLRERRRPRLASAGRRQAGSM